MLSSAKITHNGETALISRPARGIHRLTPRQYEHRIVQINLAWENIPLEIENYDTIHPPYDATNDHDGSSSTMHPEIDNNRPFMPNMQNGPYTDKNSGHSVCVVTGPSRVAGSVPTCSTKFTTRTQITRQI